MLPLEHLIGGPLQAVVDAHAVVSQAALQFLTDFGLEPLAKDEKLQPPLPRLRMVEFSYTHPVPDPANPGNVIDTPVHVQVPLLALVSPPALRIARVNLDFNIKVLGFTPVRPLEGRPPSARLPFRIQAVYAARAPTAAKPEGDPSTLAVSITLTREPVPEGTTRLLSLLQDAIVSRPLKAEPPVRGE